jgi:hypothetical protein
VLTRLPNKSADISIKIANVESFYLILCFYRLFPENSPENKTQKIVATVSPAVHYDL